MSNTICNLTDNIFNFIKKIFEIKSPYKVKQTLCCTWDEADKLLTEHPEKYKISKMEDNNRVIGIVYLDEIDLSENIND